MQKNGTYSNKKVCCDWSALNATATASMTAELPFQLKQIAYNTYVIFYHALTNIFILIEVSTSVVTIIIRSYVSQ